MVKASCSTFPFFLNYILYRYLRLLKELTKNYFDKTIKCRFLYTVTFEFLSVCGVRIVDYRSSKYSVLLSHIYIMRVLLQWYCHSPSQDGALVIVSIYITFVKAPLISIISTVDAAINKYLKIHHAPRKF